jgi:hypothetical protein
MSAGYVVLAGILIVLACSVLGVVSMFRLGSEARALRQTFTSAVPGKWERKIDLRVGWITTALVRGGSRFFNLPPEPRAALDSVRGAEVGVYHLTEEPAQLNRGRLLSQADEVMKARGWSRVVGVIEERELVAVYMPGKGVSPSRVKCCVVVLSGPELVVVSARGNLEPMMGLIEKHLDHATRGRMFAWQ